jgi:hypothetical protein
MMVEMGGAGVSDYIEGFPDDTRMCRSFPWLQFCQIQCQSVQPVSRTRVAPYVRYVCPTGGTNEDDIINSSESCFIWSDQIGRRQFRMLICVFLSRLGMKPLSIQSPVVRTAPKHHITTAPQHHTTPHHTTSLQHHTTPHHFTPHHSTTALQHHTTPHYTTAPHHTTPKHHITTAPHHNTAPHHTTAAHHSTTSLQHHSTAQHNSTTLQHSTTAPHHSKTPQHYSTTPHHSTTALQHHGTTSQHHTTPQQHTTPHHTTAPHHSTTRTQRDVVTTYTRRIPVYLSCHYVGTVSKSTFCSPVTLVLKRSRTKLRTYTLTNSKKKQ